MHAEIKFTPVEGAKYINKAIVKTYDSQGIVMSESEIFKAQSEEEKDKLEATVDIPMNGKVEIVSRSTTEVDGEQNAAVPPADQESEQVKEEKKKREEDTKRRRDEARHEAALERGLAYEGAPPKYPGEKPGPKVEDRGQDLKPGPEGPRADKTFGPGSTTPAGSAGPGAHVEKKDEKADMSKNPSPSVGTQPKPPGVQSTPSTPPSGGRK